VELTEALEANVPAVTVAWDGRMQRRRAAARSGGGEGEEGEDEGDEGDDAAATAFGAGPADLESAVQAALRALADLAPPADAAAPAPAAALGPPRHSPSREQWGAAVAATVGRLGVMRGGAQEQLRQRRALLEEQQRQEGRGEGRGQGRRPPAPGGGGVSRSAALPASLADGSPPPASSSSSSSSSSWRARPAPLARPPGLADLARSEFMAGGQPSLDALLAAIDAAGSDTSAPPADGYGGGGGGYGGGIGGGGRADLEDDLRRVASLRPPARLSSIALHGRLLAP